MYFFSVAKQIQRIDVVKEETGFHHFSYRRARPHAQLLRKHLENGRPLLAGTQEADVKRAMAPRTGWSLAVLQSHAVARVFDIGPPCIAPKTEWPPGVLVGRRWRTDW